MIPASLLSECAEALRTGSYACICQANCDDCRMVRKCQCCGSAMHLVSYEGFDGEFDACPQCEDWAFRN